MWFLLAVAAISCVGVGTRVGMVAAVHEPSQPGFLVDYDPIFYSQQANLVADGKGFIAPYLLDAAGNGPHRPSAGHPPLLVVVLAVASKLGARSFGMHRLVDALIGAMVVPLVALLGAQVGSWRAGLIAAVIAALYPNLWLYDGLLMPEALAGVLIAAALVLSLRLQRAGPERSATIAAAGLGVVIGLAALTRGEMLLLVPLLALPVCLARRGEPISRRLRLLAGATLAAVVVIAPWTLYNFSRFEKPVVISTAVDTTLGGANCTPVYHGSGIGSWTDSCFADILSRGLEESVAASEIRSRTAHFVAHHASRVPLVALARVGRTWDVFEPSQNVTLGELQHRPRVWSWLGLAMFAVLVPLAAAGALVLRRRRTSLLPLLAMPAFVTVTAVLFWGNPRFRRPAEITIIVLAAVALDAVGRRLVVRRSSAL